MVANAAPQHLRLSRRPRLSRAPRGWRHRPGRTPVSGPRKEPHRGQDGEPLGRFTPGCASPAAADLHLAGLRVSSLLIGGEIFTDRRATQLFVVVLIATTAWFLVRWITGVENELIRLGAAQQKDERRLDETTAHAIGKLPRLATMLTAALVALQYLNINISAVFTFGGIGGIAIGFAAKDLLANFFGGLTVYLDSRSKWVTGSVRRTVNCRAPSSTSAGATPAFALSTNGPSTRPTPSSPPSSSRTRSEC
jgi:hypothetical protein